MNTDVTSTDKTQPEVNFKSRLWAMSVHLSQLVPLFGALLAILIWQAKKDLYPNIEANGKVVLNWALTTIVYGLAIGFASAVFTHFVLDKHDIFMLTIIFGLLYAIFPIMGSISALRGKVWKYPFSLRFLK